MAVKSSHLTRRGHYSAVNSQNNWNIYFLNGFPWNKVHLDFFVQKEGIISLVLIAKIPTAVRTPLHQSCALPQWQLSHAVSRSQSNRNYSPAPKMTPGQSEPPLHVGIRACFQNWPIAVTKISLGPLTSRSYSGKDQSALWNKVPLLEAAGRASAVLWMLDSDVNQSNVGAQQEQWERTHAR